MDLETFKASLGGDSPPAGAGGALQALWHQARGEWSRAHRLAQSEAGAAGAWVHAHLHRVEGNQANAAYWYRRAKRPASSAPHTEEWDEIAAALTE